MPENANPIEVETGKLGIHIPTTKQQFQQMYRGGRCGADKLTLTLMKSVSAATSECSIHKPCDPNPDAFECTLVRIGYNRLDQAVYYQITLNHDKSTPLAKDSVRYKFDTLYGEDQQDVVLGKQGEYIAVKNSARIGDLKISFIYLRTTSDPSNMLLLMYSVQK